AVEHATDLLDGDFHCVGGDLRECRLESLADAGRADEDGDAAIDFELQPGVLPRARGAAFDVAADRHSVPTAVDEFSVEHLLLHPAEFREVTVERLAIVAAVALALDLRTKHGCEPIRHLGGADEIASSEFDAIEVQVLCHEVEQALAEEIRLE